MNEEWIKNQLKHEIEQETPNKLDDILKACRELQQDNVEEAGIRNEEEHPAGDEKSCFEKRRSRKLRYAVIIAAAAAVIVLAIVAGQLLMQGNPGPQPGSAVVQAPEPEQVSTERGPESTVERKTAIADTEAETHESETDGISHVRAVAKVTLDVNPSVELGVDENRNVVESAAINQDAEPIILDTELEGRDLTEAAQGIVEAMIRGGYLTDKTNAVLISVTADDKTTGQKIQADLSKHIYAYMEQSKVHASVIGQYVEMNEGIAGFAKKQGISFGKAKVIKDLAAYDSRLKEASLLNLSTQELMLLWTNRILETNGTDTDKQKKEEVICYGTVDAGSCISRDDALNKALKALNITENEAQLHDMSFDCDDGKLVYEVNIIYNGREYEVEVLAATGEILGYEADDIDSDDDDADDDADKDEDAGSDNDADDDIDADEQYEDDDRDDENDREVELFEEQDDDDYDEAADDDSYEENDDHSKDGDDDDERDDD